MYNVQDGSVLYNKTDRSVICEGCQFSHTWKALPLPHHFNETGREGN
jgi:hypothetical protein